MRVFPALSVALSAMIGLGAGPSPVWADSPIVLDGADEDVRSAILDLLPDRDPPASLFEAERVAEEASTRALTWLRSEGYYAAQVTPEASENPPVARLLIAPGPRFRFEAPQLAFDGEAPAAIVLEATAQALAPVRDGAPARAASVLEAEAAALAALQHAGHADAEPAERRILVDHATARVSATFRFRAGQATRLGAVRTEPNDVFRPSFIDSLQNWERSEPYSPQALARLRRDISSTGAVARVATRLDQPNQDGQRDVVLEIEPARRNAYELGLGFSTTEGPGVEAQWTRRNFSGRADALAVRTTLGEIQQELSIELTRPHAAGLGHAVNFGASLERESSEAFTRQGASFYASVDASPRLRLGRSFGLSLSADAFDDLAGGVTSAYVFSAFANLRNDTTAFSLDPRNGSVVDLRIEPSISTGDATLGFVRATAEARSYESFGDEDRLTLAARARLGWLEAVSGNANDVPPDRRFYAGGGGSVRGYAYNSIYPTERDLLGLAPGGQGLFEGSIEARWRFGDRLGAAAFVDGGSAFDDWSEAGDLSLGAGIGARYDLGFAPLRVDIAFPLDKSEASDDFALYISIGQAF